MENALNELKRRFIMSDSAEFRAKVGHRRPATSKFLEILCAFGWKSSILRFDFGGLRLHHQQDCVHRKNNKEPQNKVHSVIPTNQNQVRSNQTKACKHLDCSGAVYRCYELNGRSTHSRLNPAVKQPSQPKIKNQNSQPHPCPCKR